MSAASRKAKVGDKLVTDYSGALTVHTVIERLDGVRNSTSGTLFVVCPPVPKSSGRYAQIDADWFEVMP